jgi:hypothetical protein
MIGAYGFDGPSYNLRFSFPSHFRLPKKAIASLRQIPSTNLQNSFEMEGRFIDNK